MKKPSKKAFLFNTIGELISFLNQDISNRNIAIITPYYNGNLNPKSLLVKDTRNRLSWMFVYNSESNNELKTFETPKMMKKWFHNFKRYYILEDIQLLPFEEMITKQQVNVDLTKEPSIEDIATFMNIESGDSYNEKLVNHLKDHFSLSEDTAGEIREITKTNLTPIGKFQRIRIVIKNRMNELDINNEIDKILDDVFQANNKNGLTLDLEKDKSLKLNLMKTERNPNKIIEKLSSNKLEFKQANALMNKKYGGIITESIVLPNSIKENLKNHYKMLSRQLKNLKMKDEYASCMLIIDLITSIKEGNITIDGNELDEDLRCLSNLISNKMNEDDDDELPDFDYSHRPLNYVRII
jgi:hypothetical protein